MRHLLHKAVQVDLLDHKAAAAGVGEHLAGEFRGALAGGLDRLDRGPGRRSGREFGQGQARIAEDADQQVVEVVGDTPGEDGKRLGLLGLEQCLVGALALGDVAKAEGNAARRAIGQPDGSERELPPEWALGRLDLPGEGKRAAAECHLEVPEERRVFGFGDPLQGVVADLRVAAVQRPNQLAGGVVEGKDAEVRAGEDDALARAGKDGVEVGRMLAEFAFIAQLLGDIGTDAGRPDDVPIDIAEGEERDLQVDDVAILVPAADVAL